MDKPGERKMRDALNEMRERDHRKTTLKIDRQERERMAFEGISGSLEH